MKFSGKMCLKIILKVTNNQGSTLFVLGLNSDLVLAFKHLQLNNLDVSDKSTLVLTFCFLFAA